jgi:hypothetical protein
MATISQLIAICTTSLMSPRVLLRIAQAGGAHYAIYRCYKKYCRELKHRREAHIILDDGMSSNYLAMDQVGDDADHIVPHLGPLAITEQLNAAQPLALIGEGAVVPYAEPINDPGLHLELGFDGLPMALAVPEPDMVDSPNNRNNMVLENSPFIERRHRRLPRERGGHLKYMHAVVAEIKVRVGTPTNREANRQIVRRLARGIMDSHGVRPAHQAATIPLIVEAVLTPSDDELYAIDWARSWEVRGRRAQLPRYTN